MWVCNNRSVPSVLVIQNKCKQIRRLVAMKVHFIIIYLSDFYFVWKGKHQVLNSSFSLVFGKFKSMTWICQKRTVWQIQINDLKLPKTNCCANSNQWFEFAQNEPFGKFKSMIWICQKWTVWQIQINTLNLPKMNNLKHEMKHDDKLTIFCTKYLTM